jgi:hypothetical protein
MLAFARSQEASPHDYFLVSEGYVIERSNNSSPAPRTFNIRSAKDFQQASAAHWQIAISTFFRTFLEKAGIKSKVIDTGLSIRDTIAGALTNNNTVIKSCSSPDLSRMETLSLSR